MPHEVLCISNNVIGSGNIKLGEEIGLNFPSYSLMSAPVNADLKNATGFHFGPVIEIAPKKSFGLNIGVLCNYNTIKVDYATNNTITEEQLKSDVNRMLTLCVPLLLECRIHVKDHFGVYAEGGPYADYGFWALASTTKQLANSNTTSSYEKFNYGNFDYGVMLGGGIEYGFLKFGLSYTYGFPSLDAININDAMFNLKTRMLQINVTIR